MQIGVYYQTIRGGRRIVGKCFVTPGLREVFSQVVVPSVHLLRRSDAWTWDLAVMAMIEREPPDYLLMTDRATGDQWLIGWTEFLAHRYQTTPSEVAGPKWACPRKHWQTDQRVTIPYVREEVNADAFLAQWRAGQVLGAAQRLLDGGSAPNEDTVAAHPSPEWPVEPPLDSAPAEELRIRTFRDLAAAIALRVSR